MAELEIAKLEVVETEPEAAPAAPVAAPPPAAAPSFQNPVAIRVGLSMAGMAILLTCIPILNLGALMWQFGAGFFAAVLFSRRTGRELSLREGARMGWITGVLNAAFLGALSTLAITAAHLMPPVADLPPQAQEALKFLKKPDAIATVVFEILFFMVLCTLGGLLAARLRRPRV